MPDVPERPRRRLVPLLLIAVVVLAVAAVGLALLGETSRPRPGAGRGEELYLSLCAHCHGTDGRGSWRAKVFLLHPGDLTSAAEMRGTTDRYLADIIRYGGSPIGRPGMPGFESLSDADLAALVRHVKKMAGPEMAPRTPPRSERPGEPGPLLDSASPA